LVTRFLYIPTYSITLYPNLQQKEVTVQSGSLYKKVKIPLTDPKAQSGGIKGIALLFLDLSARRGGWSAPRTGRYTPGKTRYQLYRRLGGPSGRAGRVQKISPPLGFDPWTVQPVASRVASLITLTCEIFKPCGTRSHVIGRVGLEVWKLREPLTPSHTITLQRTSIFVLFHLMPSYLKY
jgi:hypothetical protein